MNKLRLMLLLIGIAVFSINSSFAQEQTQEIVSSRAKFAEVESNLINDMISYDGTPDSILWSNPTTVRTKNFFKKVYQYFQQANIDKSYKKKMDFSAIAGPHYAKEVGFALGIMCSGIYRTDYTDPLMQPSTMTIFSDISTSGFYLLGVRGNHLFPKRKHRLDYTAYFYSFPSGFWGIGYNNGYGSTDGKPLDPLAPLDDPHLVMPGRYKRFNSLVKADYSYVVAKGLSIGANISASYVHSTKWDSAGLKLIEQVPGVKLNYFTAGIGAFVMYDTRDFIPNPSRGIYAKVDQRFHPSLSGKGNNTQFSSTEVNFNAYKKLWKGAILAYDFHALFTYGNVPWTQYYSTGGSYRSRGYYEGRFRDKMGFETQLELRQRIWRRIGIVAWGGFANVFSGFDKYRWDQSLPNWGIGLRWEFKNKINVRLDWGWGEKDAFGIRQNGIIFNINEAF